MACALAAGLLAGCASDGGVVMTGDFDARPEKAVFAALRETGADDAQRRAVLDAYDRAQPELKRLEAEHARLLASWRALDRRAAGFAAEVDALSEQWAALEQQRMRAQGAFEREVAALLDAEQWTSWREYWAQSGLDAARGPGGRPPRR